MKAYVSLIAAIGLAAGATAAFADSPTGIIPPTEESFSAADADGNGEISSREYLDQTQSLGLGGWFNEADENGNGTLDHDEYFVAQSLAITSQSVGA